MARVTKINVGGTNYDIAHEGELKNSGFEVVTKLPTTGLFAGREVIYKGKKYVYSSGWKEEITANTMYEANLLWGGKNIANSFSPVDAAMMSELSANVMAFPNPEGISIEYSRDGGVTWLDYGATDEEKVNLFTSSTNLYCGKSDPDGLLATVGYQLRITITPIDCPLYTDLNKIITEVSTNGGGNCWCTVKGLKAKEVAAGNEDDTYYDTFVNKAYINGWAGFNVLNFNNISTSFSITRPNQADSYYRLRLIFGYNTLQTQSHTGLTIISLRFFGDRRYTLPSNLARYNHLYTYDWQQNAKFPARVESEEFINFDVNNIEPTQTGNVTKTSTWLWQYLTQGVNWLKANKVALSVYNAKVAELVQADSDNNTLSQSVRTDLTELSNGLAAVATSGSYNDLTDKPTFSGSYNDLTDKPTLFSGSYDDLTNKPTLATVATSGSYNDLTDKPTFSGSYNDLTDKPTLFSGSYDDLTNKPTLFSGSYNDLTNKPNLAAVATSGSYNDLTDKPTFSGSYNDLTDKPTIPNSFTDLSGTISSVQIPDGLIANSKLANSSMTLNGINCELGGTKTLPCIISFDSTLYKVRIYQNWLQIYHAGTWVNKYYLSSNPPTECRYITDLSDPSWYDELVSEYELDSIATEQLLHADSSTNIANWIEAINANQITFNSSVIPCKEFNKGALDNIISNLKGKGYSVFVENDIDTILNSGNDWVMSIKIKRFNDTYKAIIECYVAR